MLSDTFRGISFDEHGVCNFCRNFKGEEALYAEKQLYASKFQDLLGQVKGTGEYDSILAYSGGKDSTYTLYLLKHVFGLKTLAITFDNGFISEQAFKNIRTVVENLGIDSVVFKPDFQVLRKIFKAGIDNTMYPAKALERASTICTSCIGFVKFTALKFVCEKQIPLMAWGWSPGQAPIRSSIMKINPALFKTTQEMYRKPMQEIAGESVNRYFLTEAQFKQLDFAYNVSPLAFMDYDEHVIIKKIQEFGWVNPEGLDSNSTNCLLNTYANKVHIEKHGFHPYAFEIAGMVRTGVMSRDMGMEKIYKKDDAITLVDFALKKLGNYEGVS